MLSSVSEPHCSGVHLALPDLVRGELRTSVHIYQLEEQGKVLMAVCDECTLGFGWVGHPERDII